MIEVPSFVCLRVWAEDLMFVNFSERELAEVKSEFYGAVHQGCRAPSHVFVRRNVPPHSSAPVRSIVRHLGGSSSQKFFLDNANFDSGIQSRSAEVIVETDSVACYTLSGAHCDATRDVTILTGETLDSYVLVDTVENFLLSRARQRGWVQCHAAALAWHDGAILFAGSSGTGKTTGLLEALKTGGTLLSNDRVFARMEAGRPEVRGFPLPMNVGCGTIRALDLPLPHFDRPDDHKLRLTPEQVANRFQVDYETWYPVVDIRASGFSDLGANIYWRGDCAHPFWNAMQRPAPISEDTALSACLFERVTVVEPLRRPSGSGHMEAQSGNAKVCQEAHR